MEKSNGLLIRFLKPIILIIQMSLFLMHPLKKSSLSLHVLRLEVLVEDGWFKENLSGKHSVLIFKNPSFFEGFLKYVIEYKCYFSLNNSSFLMISVPDFPITIPEAVFPRLTASCRLYQFTSA